MGNKKEYEYIPIDVDELFTEKGQLKISKSNFTEGAKKGSYYAGIFSALVSAGMSKDSAAETILAEINNKIQNK